MTIKRMIAIIFIFLLGVAGWLTLGTTSHMRSASSYSSMDYAVQDLWGNQIHQAAPNLSVKVPGTKRQRKMLPESNHIDVEIDLEQRKKGLIWYPTYKVKFDATYSVINRDRVAQSYRLHFPLPSESATYEYFKFLVDGQLQQFDFNASEGIHYLIELQPDQKRTFTIQYHTRGLRTWTYNLSNEQGRVKRFDLQLKTNFSAVDFKSGSLSPMKTEVIDQQTLLSWKADDLFTKQAVSIVLPEKLNPGPLSARMTYFAPVCLLFFFVLIAALGVVHRVEIHPMHYLFVTAGFFAFHLLFAYLIDVINVHFAFFISSITSVSLVVFYLKNALGRDFPWKFAALGQIVYLVLFSYTFFIKGMTGLTVTIGSILTLSVIMYLTVGTNWTSVFVKKQPQSTI